MALSSGGQLFADTHPEGRQHAQSLLPMIDAQLARAGIGLRDLDGLAVVHGPGSFTGIRIAMSIAQGLAFAADLPLYCESSLRCLAYAALQSPSAPSAVNQILVASDARMHEFYWQMFSVDNAGLPQATGRPRADSYARFTELLPPLNEHSLAVGKAWQLNAVAMPGCPCLPQLEADAATLLALLDREPDLEPFRFDPRHAEPLYVRNEVAWQKRQRLRPHQ